METDQQTYERHVGERVRVFYDDEESVRKKQGELVHTDSDSIEINEDEDGLIILEKSRLVRTEVMTDSAS